MHIDAYSPRVHKALWNAVCGVAGTTMSFVEFKTKPRSSMVSFSSRMRWTMTETSSLPGMGCSLYVIPTGCCSDLMYFSDWQWLLFAVFRKSQPPLFILLLNSIMFAPSWRHCLPSSTPFFLSFPRSNERGLRFTLKRRTNGLFFMSSADLWGQSLLIEAWG